MIIQASKACLIPLTMSGSLRSCLCSLLASVESCFNSTCLIQALNETAGTVRAVHRQMGGEATMEIHVKRHNRPIVKRPRSQSKQVQVKWGLMQRTTKCQHLLLAVLLLSHTE